MYLRPAKDQLLCARPPAPPFPFTRCSPSGGVRAGSTGRTRSATRPGRAARGGPLGAVGGEQPALAVPGHPPRRAGSRPALRRPRPRQPGLGRGGQRADPGRGAHRGDDGRPQPWALYDTGQAVAALVTQAQADGLAVHQMGGFDTDAVRAGFGLGENLTPGRPRRVGRQDSAAGLPEAAGRPRGGPADQAPGQRPAAARPRRASAGRGLGSRRGRAARETRARPRREPVNGGPG